MRPDSSSPACSGSPRRRRRVANAYLKVNTAPAPEPGSWAQTMQYHGTADRYTLNGATAVATLYSNATTATSNPAVTLRSVGYERRPGGGVHVRPRPLGRLHAPGQPGLGGPGARRRRPESAPNDMFYGPASATPADWLDTTRSRSRRPTSSSGCSSNLITLMNARPDAAAALLVPAARREGSRRDERRRPLGRQAPGGTAFHFDRFKSLSPAGCVVALWECVRSTSYIYPDSALTNAQAAGYVADGFELGAPPSRRSCPTSAISEAQLSAIFDTQLGAFRSQVHRRAGAAHEPHPLRLLAGLGIHGEGRARARDPAWTPTTTTIPASWIGAKPGFLNGGGFPMRFADTDRHARSTSTRQNTNMNDEAGTRPTRRTSTRCSTRRSGPTGYYGAFGVEHAHGLPGVHAGQPKPSSPPHRRAACPVISYKQLLDWIDGRNNSTIRGLNWSAAAP